jgi:N-acyl-D-aspartate/D-glutamate deacylase
VLGKYARDEKLFPLEEAVRKMTSLPASILGLKDRGMLKKGAFADLVIFDPDNVADQATFENPKQYPVGIPYVMVNGEFAIFQEEHTGKLSGRVLLGGLGKGGPKCTNPPSTPSHCTPQ